MRPKLTMVALMCLVAGAAGAQPTMDSLWPAADGTRWEYQLHIIDHLDDTDFTSPAYLQLSGTAMIPGGEAQILLAEHDPVPSILSDSPPALPPLLARIWRARPDLREAIAKLPAVARHEYWWPLFLHGGYFMKGDDDIQMWQDPWLHPTWTYLENDISAGATFVHQLVPELADDIFLHGTVAEIGAAVTTPAGTFMGAVRMDYLIDMGVAVFVDEQGNLIGTHHGETAGHVHYVPGVGPVDMLEEWIPLIWLDCGEEDCPPELEALVGVLTQTCSLELTRLPVSNEPASWGEIKSMYR
ncbi:hypothetical protein H8E07_11455 [bacterium]|nr:hypothetical protein [bacterium]